MSIEVSSNDVSIIDDKFISEVYKQMLAFATSQLKDADTAQDVVQDAMVAALNYSDKFKGQSSLKTWVFSILKNKIIDHFRKEKKYVAIGDLHSDSNQDSDSASESEEALLQTLFDASGFWHKNTKPTAFDNSWSNPEMQIQGEGFFEVMEICLSNLPAEQSRAFLMREYIELDTDEICKEMDITTSKFYVLMHRARLLLQKCLNVRWFDNKDSPTIS